MMLCLVQVAEQYLNIIDHIQQVNESVVQESERETGVSKRLLHCYVLYSNEGSRTRVV